MRIIEPLEAGNVYHIYNRGNNSEDIFKEKRNYYYFLQKYNQYCSPVFETYAYALLKNHFHLMVRVKANIFGPRTDGNGGMELKAFRQFSHFCNCYAQSINKAYNRHGKLFEAPFRRIEVENDEYFTALIYYMHFNPQRHGLVNDFRNWEFSSWHDYITDSKSLVDVSSGVVWFGTKEHFIEAHLGNLPLDKIAHLIIE